MMKQQKSTPLFRIVFVFFILSTLVFSPQAPASAATTFTVTPITWNVIGLDSNNVNVGPNHFPVGARVCNIGASNAMNVTATLVWDSSNTLINIRPGTNSSITVSSIPSTDPDTCVDFYFEVEVTRNASAYNTTRRYHIAVTADGGTTTGSTPTPRELFVEHLISQSRNATTDIQLSTNGTTYSSVGPGGTMTLMVGQTYWIKLVGKTATNGYEQIETFINLPNTIFQTLSVTTTYTAESSGSMSPPYTTQYGDACTWENNPNDPNYRACLETGKAGGDITVTYKVKILSIPSSPLTNPEALQSLIYDFSGSSYHYNSDFGVSTRYVNIVNASIVKAFSPKVINSIPAGTSTLTFTINNPGPQAISSVNFTDNLPSGVTITSTVVTYTGCGSPSPSSLTLGATSLSFSNITVNGLGTCTISVKVTASAVGTYVNTSNHLYIGTIDTGSYATDTLIVTSKPAGPETCPSPVTLATWTMPTSGQGSGGPPPPYTTRAADVSYTNASSAGGTPGISTTDGNPANSWYITGGWNTIGTLPNSGASPYFQFALDTSNYGGVFIAFDLELDSNGDWGSGATDNVAYVYSQKDGGAFTTGTGTVVDKTRWSRVTYVTPTAGTGLGLTNFRINIKGAPLGKPDAMAYIDNVTISGCPRLLLPTLSKAFSPASIPQGSASTLTFTFANPNSSTSLTGVGFKDTLPTGLVINTPSGLTTPSCTTGSISGQTITATAGTSLIQMSGGTLAANSSCSFSVSVKGNIAGYYQNISESITSTQTGPNTTSTGYGTSSLTVIAPPVIAKSFGASTIISGTTTSLTFAISNPNIATTLTGVNFTDNLPSGLVVATPNGLSGTCGGGTIIATAGSSTISLSGASLNAGASCTFSVNVTGTTTGLKVNSVTVSSTNGGTGNTAYANILVKVLTPAISLLKQVGASATGPWYSFVVIEPNADVFYRFLVENTGDVPLTDIDIADPNVNTSGCAWTDPDPLPVADAYDDDHITTCVVQGADAIAGELTNTARADGTYNGAEYYSNYSSATYKNTPTAVTMASFTAVSMPWKVVVMWETALESNALGFNLYRAASLDGERALLNPELIPSRALDGTGAFYQFTDTEVQPGVTYYYWLEFIDVKGSEEFGPVPAMILSNRIFLPVIRKL